MWRIENLTPFAADSAWHRDAEGAEVWVVAVKATYDVLPDGQLCVCDFQPAPCSGPQPLPGLQSPRYDTDFGPRKTGTDVLLVGHAHAQEGTATQLPVALRVGPVSRTLRIWGDRHWQPPASPGAPWRMSEPVPFARMPLVFDRAFGGTLDGVPVPGVIPAGRGLVDDARRSAVPMPNIEDAAHPVRDIRDRPEPAGVGVVASHWPWRSRHAGTHDEAWMTARRPLPPTDQDARFFRVAPPSQQAPEHLRGGEPVTLLNLTPPGFSPSGRIDFTLPRLSLSFTTFFDRGPRVRSRSVIHTVIVEPDFPRVSVVHHMALPCHTRVNLLRRTVIDVMERPLDRDSDTAPAGDLA